MGVIRQGLNVALKLVNPVEIKAVFPVGVRKPGSGRL
jgi:hypothetical protein